MSEIKITCEYTELIPYSSLAPFQGALKTISKKNLEKLKNLIIIHGFNVPCFVWKQKNKYYILDGHQRYHAIKSLIDDGFSFENVPVVAIHAKTRQEAKQKLLGITSSFGEFDIIELESWIKKLEFDMSENFRFLLGEIDFEEFEVIENNNIESHDNHSFWKANENLVKCIIGDLEYTLDVEIYKRLKEKILKIEKNTPHQDVMNVYFSKALK